MASWLVRRLLKPHRSSYNEFYMCTHGYAQCPIRNLKAGCMLLDAAGGKLLHDPEKACQSLLACQVSNDSAVNDGVRPDDQRSRMQS